MTYKNLSVLHLLYLHSIKKHLLCLAAYLFLAAGLFFYSSFTRGAELSYGFYQTNASVFLLTDAFRILSALFVASFSFISLEASSGSFTENTGFVGRLGLSEGVLKKIAFFYQILMFFLMHASIVLTNILFMKLHFLSASLGLNERAELSARMMNNSFPAKIFVFFDFSNYLVLLAGVLFIFLFSILLELGHGFRRLVNLFLALLIAYLTVFMHG